MQRKLLKHVGKQAIDYSCLKNMEKKGVVMCRVKAKVERGATNSERVAYIKTTGGPRAEVVLDVSQVGGNHIVVAEVVRREDCVLIELPRETSSGDWRVWVNKNQIMK